MDKFYMVLCESTGYTKYKHDNYQSALAKAKTDNVIVEEVLQDDIPF